MIDPVFNDKCTTLIVNCSNLFMPYMDVCFQSVLDHADQNHFYDFVVLSSTLTKESKAYIESKYSKNNSKVRFFDPSDILDIENISETLPNYSKESFFKILIPRIFPKYKKIIYADVDIIFNCDIQEIQNIDLKGCPIGATRDFALSYVAERINPQIKNYIINTLHIKDIFDYFAAGIIVFDLKNWKEQDVDDMLNMAHNFQFRFQEQDVFNKHFHGNIFDLPYRYCINTAFINELDKNFLSNEQYYKNCQDAIMNPKVIHYSGTAKPWQILRNDKYEKMWWKAAEKTIFYDLLLTVAKSNELKKNIILKYGKPVRYHKYRVLSKITLGKTRSKYKNKYKQIKTICKNWLNN